MSRAARSTPSPGPFPSKLGKGSALRVDGLLCSFLNFVVRLFTVSSTSHPSPVHWGRAGDGVEKLSCSQEVSEGRAYAPQVSADGSRVA